LKAQQIHIDPQLLVQVARGEEKSFTELVETFSGVVFNYIRQHTKDRAVAEEIVQDIFVQIWLARDTLTEVRNFHTFLYVVTRNYAMNTMKKLLREKERLEKWKSDQPKGETPANTEEDPQEWMGLIDKAVSQLPPQQQKVWLLSRKQGLKHAEIAGKMNLSKETVKKYIQHATTHITVYISQRMDLMILLLLLKK
jgi:RNA polymerase sigma-70 factor (family 1)